MRILQVACVLLLLVNTASDLNAAEQTEQQPFSFVIIGHLRAHESGQLHYLLDDLLAQVDRLEPTPGLSHIQRSTGLSIIRAGRLFVRSVAVFPECSDSARS